jgi:hypothetical protein
MRYSVYSTFFLSIKGLHLQFFLVVTLAVMGFALSSEWLGNPSYGLFSAEAGINEATLPYDRLLLPLEPGSLDSIELAPNQESSGVDDELLSPPTDGSVSISPGNSASSVDGFSTASDLFASTDCSNTGNSLFPTIGKSRLKRANRCDAVGNFASPHTLSVPTVEEFDPDIRVTILTENPGLREVLRLAEENEEQSTVCILLTNGKLPLGGCTSNTTADWFHTASMTFSWNPNYIVTLWQMDNITPGMINSKETLSNPSNLS